jgi:CTP:molybdopterin cytidylyltransferase MocA
MPVPRSGAPWAIVLAGGRSSRFGADKTAAPLGRGQVLGTLLAGLPPWLPVVLVGPPRDVGRDLGPVARTLRQAREDPPGGGPVAALAAGVASLPEGTGVAVVLAGDQPFAGAAVPRLLAALGCGPDSERDPPRGRPEGGVTSTGRDVDAALGVAPDGSRKLLCLAVRVPVLRAALPAEPAGRSVRSLVLSWAVAEVPLTAREALDVDTPADLARAEALR